MSPIAAFLDGKIPEDELFQKVEQILVSGTEADRTILLVDWRTKSGRIRALDTRRILDEKLRQFSGVLLDDMQRALTEGLARNTPTLEPGRILANRFVLEGKIGSGGMSEVFRCRDLRREEAHDRNPYVALKMLRPDVVEREDSIKILQREARKAQNLAHPNIVRVYDFDRDGDILFITMELLAGASLEEIIRANGLQGSSLAESTPILTQIANALQFAHQEGIVHSDLKPSNILVQPNGRVKIIDFGISRARADLQQSTSDRTTFDVHALGAMTPAYASPEMIDGAPPDPRDDVFAFACITYELLTGRHPFGRTPANIARAGKFQPTAPTNLSARQWQGLLAGLCFEREHRTPTPEALLAEVMAASPPMRSSRKRVGSAAAILVVVAGGAFLLDLGTTGKWPFGGADQVVVGTTTRKLAQQQAAEVAARKLAQQQAAEDAARKLAQQKAAEDAARRLAEQKAAEDAARKLAHQQAAEDAARKLAHQQAAEDAARKLAQQQAAEDAARKLAQQKAADDAARKLAEQQAAEDAARELAEQQAAEDAARKLAQQKAAEDAIGPQQIAQAQGRLNALGLETGPPDGKLGPRTTEMIRGFQAASGVETTGQLTSDLLSALLATTPSASSRAAALFGLAAEAQKRHQAQDAVRLYRLGLQLAPRNTEASQQLKELLLATDPPERSTASAGALPGGHDGDQRDSSPPRSEPRSAAVQVASNASARPGSQQQAVDPRKKFDGFYTGELQPTWFSSPKCRKFSRIISIRNGKLYFQYRRDIITAIVQPDGSFKGSDELSNIHMEQSIFGSVNGNTIDAHASNRLCGYHGSLVKSPN